jgi:hypothetical protein
VVARLSRDEVELRNKKIQQLLQEESSINGEIKQLNDTQPPPGDLASQVQTRKEQLTAKLAARQQLLAELLKGGCINPCKGFWYDILSDEHGVSFHRFQMVIWTLCLTLVFAWDVYYNLAMPEFSPTLLGLMGISSGTYLGFKLK